MTQLSSQPDVMDVGINTSSVGIYVSNRRGYLVMFV